MQQNLILILSSICVLQCNDPCDLPTIQYNFVNISDLGNFKGDDIVGEYSVHNVNQTLDHVYRFNHKLKRLLKHGQQSAVPYLVVIIEGVHGIRS